MAEDLSLVAELESDSDSDSEDFMEGVKGATFSDYRQGRAGTPIYPTPVTYPTQLNKGDHIIFQTEDSAPPLRPLFQSALVTGAEAGESIRIISYSRCGIYEDDIIFDSLKRLHKVEYTRCRYSGKMSVSRAKWRLKAGEDHYHVLFNNSHHFATWAKTGNEYFLYDVIDCLMFEEGRQYALNPVLSQSTITSLTDITAGDHLIMESQHYLVHSVNTDTGTFGVYTVRGGRIVSEEKAFSQNGIAVICVDYDQQSNLYHPGKAVQNASEEMEREEKWESSDCFVTMMKCGKKHVLSPKCLLQGDVEPVGCTCVTPHVAVDVGDHLIVRGTFGEYKSVLVYNCVNEHTIVSIPNLHKQSLMGRLNLLDYNEIYRVNYPQSLPVQEILRRSCSLEGEKMLMEEGVNPASFVSWVKIGKQLSINVTKYIGKEQIAHIRPCEYEKILCVDDIQVGDHLFMPNFTYRWHFLVTEKVVYDKEKPVFGTIYCLRGSITETQEKIDPTRDDVFKILYPEVYPPSLAVYRARSQLDEINLNPTARMWFVRWAKTGSDEGLEIDFLKRKSMPVAKSRILCFTQLNPGNYLVQDKGRFFVRRHYIVVSVQSANTCTVIGAWKGRVQETQLTLDSSVYHRILYEERVCIPLSQSILRARELMNSPFGPKLFRRKFVNYVKTTDSVEIDVENLPEDRLLLKRESVESAADLRLGDHVELPCKKFQGVSYQDMIVTSVLGPEKVRVLCFGVREGKEKLIETELDVTGEAELYRVKYLERLNPEEGIRIVRRSLDSPANKENANVLMLSTVGQAISVEVNPQLHKILQCSKQDIRRAPSSNRARQVSIEVGSKTSMKVAFRFGSRVLLHGTRLGQVVGFGPGINILAEAPFFTRRIYKLSRAKKFDQISEEDYMRGVIKQSFTSANTIVGGTAGAIIGQVVIPVPILGAVVGAAVGSISGNGFGRLEGWAASKIIRDPRIPTLPLVVKMNFIDYPPEQETRF